MDARLEGDASARIVSPSQRCGVSRRPRTAVPVTMQQSTAAYAISECDANERTR
jgi:hypothetical protein